jgi:hypothetical protein
MRVGRRVAQTVAGRLARSLLELGGNNAIIVSTEADLDLAVRADPLWRGGHRRPALHDDAAADRARKIVVADALGRAAGQGLPPGAHRRPAAPGTLMGPLVNARRGGDDDERALARAWPTAAQC